MVTPWNMLRKYRTYVIGLLLSIGVVIVMEHEWIMTENADLRNSTLLLLWRGTHNTMKRQPRVNQPTQPPVVEVKLPQHVVHIPTPKMLPGKTAVNDSLLDRSVSEDDRFRQEISAYYDSVKLPKTCDDVDRSPPKPVKSQKEYANCSVPRVPNVVHLVWLYGKTNPMNFRQLLSILSMLRFIQPCAILFWYDGSAPSGQYWQHFLRNVTAQNIEMRMLNITVPNKIWGKKIAYKEHKTDIIRFEVLKNFGGMYMDLDVIILKSVRPLRCYDYTLGREDPIRLPASLVFSVPKAPFLLKIIENYKHYRRQWAFNSVEYPHELAKEFPDLIHVETSSINRPSWHPGQLNSIFDGSCVLNLSKNYALHLWNHNSKDKNKVEDPESIKTMRSTFGQVARFIYHGQSGPCKI